MKEMNINLMPCNKVIFIQKIKSGYMINYICKFLGVKSGIVRGKIIDVEPEWAKGNLIGQEITGRLNKCYVKDYTNKCCWFNGKRK